MNRCDRAASTGRPPPHVAFFNRAYHPEPAGPGRLLAELAEDLVREPGARASVVAGIPFLAGFRLKRPDVVLALTDPPIIGLAAWFHARRYRIPFVLGCHSLYPEVARSTDGLGSRLAGRIRRAVSRFLVRRADRVVAAGETMRRRLVEEKGAEPWKVVLIPNWEDCSHILPGPKENPFSREHGLVGKFVVMHSGEMGFAEDLEILLEAAGRLQALPDLEFVLVGDGIRRAALEERVRERGLENVRFLPFPARRCLAESFASANVFVISLAKGLAGYVVPSKVYGVLAAGRPYVAAVEDDCEVATLTRREGCGLVVEPGSAAMLAEGILALYRDGRYARRLGCRARAVAGRFDRPVQVDAYRSLFRGLAGEPASRWGLVRASLKRSFDLMMATVGLILFAPVWAAVALAVKVEDGGPVLRAHERVGMDGRRFRALKFRTVQPDASLGGVGQPGRGESRVTRVGRLLRATAVEEVPRLWNILVGDMSFVGPRALAPEETERVGERPGKPAPIDDVPGFEERHRVRPGLTGIAQLYAPRGVAPKRTFRLDRLYIRRQTLWLDVRLVAASVSVSLRGAWDSEKETLR